MSASDDTAGAPRTGAERLAETRTRLLEAVIASLAERGYAETSTTEIARRSGLTRGAQLHHFGTKDQMMVAAVEHLTEQVDAVEVAAALAQITDEHERIETALEILSQLSSGPLPVAYVELWVGSRGRPDLADALHASDEAARAGVLALFGPELVTRAGPEFEPLLDLTLYALRGMALDAHLASAEEQRARVAIIRGLAPQFEIALRVSTRQETE
jgi:AcrR family transcriptional regulator